MRQAHVDELAGSGGWSRSQWLTLAGCTLALVVGTTPIVSLTFGIFLLPISEDFGWNREVLSTANAIAMIGNAVAVPVLGRLLDHYNPRLILGVGCVLFAAATASLALISSSYLLLFLLYALWGAASSVQTPVGYSKIVSAWFDKNRGLAIGVMLLGSAGGSMLIPHTVQALIAHFGWRGAYAALGCIVLLIAAPVHLFLVRWPPRRGSTSDLQPDAAGDVGPGLAGVSLKAAVASLPFWFIAIAMFLMANVILGVQLHFFPLLKDHGFSSEAAATLLSVAGLAMVAGRLVAGLAMDRFDTVRVTACFFLFPVFSIAILAFPLGMAGAVVAALILGLCAGGEVAVASILTAKLFGLRAFGQIFAWIFFGFAIGSGLGPWLMARSFVLWGSYFPCLLLLASFCVAASLLILAVGKFRPPLGAQQQAPG